MAHFCTITVKGTGSEGYHGDTHRPRRDQTRSLDKFFRGMSAYGRAVTDHVLGCSRCTPAKILPLLRDPHVRATMQPDRMIKRLMRQDPRTPRRAYARALGSLGHPHHVKWAARFLNAAEFWQFLQGLQEANDRMIAQHAAWGHTIAATWRVQVPDPEARYPWERKPVMLHEALGLGTSPRNRELARAAATLNMWGCRIPSTQRELRKILPLAEVHGS